MSKLVRINLALTCFFVLLSGCAVTQEFTKQDEEVAFVKTDGSFRFKIVESQSKASATPQLKQITIKMAMTNITNTPKALGSETVWVMKLVNQQGIQYAPTAYVGNFVSFEINPGMTEINTVTFDVPSGSYVLKVDINNLGRAGLGSGDGTVRSFQLPITPIEL